MNRSPILPPVVRGTPVRSDAKVRTFADAELAADKVKAFFDLYDVSNLRGIYKSLEPGAGKDPSARALLRLALRVLPEAL